MDQESIRCTLPNALHSWIPSLARLCQLVPLWRALRKSEAFGALHNKHLALKQGLSVKDNDTVKMSQSDPLVAGNFEFLKRGEQLTTSVSSTTVLPSCSNAFDKATGASAEPCALFAAYPSLGNFESSYNAAFPSFLQRSNDDLFFSLKSLSRLFCEENVLLDSETCRRRRSCGLAAEWESALERTHRCVDHAVARALLGVRPSCCNLGCLSPTTALRDCLIVAREVRAFLRTHQQSAYDASETLTGCCCCGVFCLSCIVCIIWPHWADDGGCDAFRPRDVRRESHCARSSIAVAR